MIALDTNILVYAHRQDSPFHSAALSVLDQLGNGNRAWAIPYPCVHEFLGITTHPRIYQPPSSFKLAFKFLQNWQQSPHLQLLHEGQDHLEHLHTLCTRAKLSGPKVHDARIAAICLSHGVDVLYSADRDFSHFPELTTANPLL